MSVQRRPPPPRRSVAIALEDARFSSPWRQFMQLTMPLPTPNLAEKTALFRHGVVGDLITSDLEPGALTAELKSRSRRRYRPPGADATRTYHWKTFQRWLYSARESLVALKPASRQRGCALRLEEEARECLLDMRREHPSAAADLMLDEAVRNCVIVKGDISVPTLRRLLARAGLARGKQSRAEKRRDRRRWEADRPCRIWHADVCHVWLREADGTAVKAYVHGFLDDHSRFVPGLDARAGETENDLLAVLVEALLRYPAPEVLYVDNGSTYRGELLTLALARLGIRVVHPAPYDPEGLVVQGRRGQRPAEAHPLAGPARGARRGRDDHRPGCSGPTRGRPKAVSVPPESDVFKIV